ncbi:formimidoylglutamate deiminase [Nocardioides sp. Leaf307]|uniref:formimidoylglutamate deiminase n=1 Tax=Nocardioides sp. Leaf307 TaxID=1736331 RepID=UPI0009EA06C4|nr:formimidoylglutamate deiminase [Nocardioides sp. Leaf307]
MSGPVTGPATGPATGPSTGPATGGSPRGAARPAGAGAGAATAAYVLRRAWVGGATRDDVLVEVADGRFTRVEPGGAVGEGREAVVLDGLVVPGQANAHSHAFHRALRGRTQRGRGTFWTWREQMYAVAARLDPDSYHRLARAVLGEIVASGVTTLGEFHYLHHRPDGTPYPDHAMELALVEAARAVGLRLTLLDTCYLSSGFGAPVEGVQRRCSDGSAQAWAERRAALIERLHGSDDVVVGAAIHSVRAVPRADLPTVVAAAAGGPLHVHLSEQPAENAACLAAHGVTPTRLLADAGALGPRTTAVHATHLTDADVDLLGGSGTRVCLCPTTERDLGDGVGPARRLADAGAVLSLGSDSHAVVDPWEEMRALELDERLTSRRRGHWSAGELLAAGTDHAGLGFPDAGRLEVGARADLVVLDTTSPRTAGTGDDEHTAVFAASAADVLAVMVDGRWVVGPRAPAPDQPLGAALAAAIQEVLP